MFKEIRTVCFITNTAWKVSVFRVILNTISPYSVRMRDNTDQNNSEYRHFLRRVRIRICCMTNIETSFLPNILCYVLCFCKRKYEISSFAFLEISMIHFCIFPVTATYYQTWSFSTDQRKSDLCVEKEKITYLEIKKFTSLNNVF